MADVLAFPGRERFATGSDRLCSLVSCFATQRRNEGDVFWLKENAELLNILECTGQMLSDQALEPHMGFYDQIERQICFFRQYYRFMLSICLDLEDLGGAGDKGQQLAEWVHRQGLVDAELSDLQRAEAHRLLQRRGIGRADAGLNDRLHDFISRTFVFAMPNKKAAYELTHIVFYLSEYGRRDPCLSDEAKQSLEFAGLLAYLEQNADLLAEICTAMRYAGQIPPHTWETWLHHHLQGFTLEPAGFQGHQDDYHEFFVCNWWAAAAGHRSFGTPVPEGSLSVTAPHGAGVLNSLSRLVYEANDSGFEDWQTAKNALYSCLNEAEHAVLRTAEESTPCFEGFFAGFARTGTAGV